jgi:hypothetical protein
MPARAPNLANAVGCPTTHVTKATKIFALGHLKTHIDAKVELLRKEGYTEAEPMYAQLESVDEMKAKLKAASAAPAGALLFVGGAMMHTHPDTMKELFAFIPAECPALAVDIVHMPDFAAACPGRTPPFSSEEVAAASVFAIKEIAAATTAPE